MASLQEVFNHLVMPPKLPPDQDADVGKTGNDILYRLTNAATTMKRLAGEDQAPTWDAVCQSLRRCESLHAFGRLEKQSLIAEFKHLLHDQPLFVHVIEQNAALIIRRNTSIDTDVVIFEAFEVSPPSAEVLASENALIWNFPDCATQIPFSESQKPSLQEALADFLEKGSMEPLRQFQAHTTKARVSIVESRDTANPALVTHLLIPLLESIGSFADVNVAQIRKRVRDDVNIRTGESPWRRLPLWLVLRVCVQRQLQLSLGHEAGRVYYKFLVTIMLTELLNACPGQLAPEMTMTLRAKICRRLAKLEQERSNSPLEHDRLFAATGTFFRESIMRVSTLVESAWDKYKRASIRPIPRLPMRADEDSQYLSLPNSGAYLQHVLDLPRVMKYSPQSMLQPPSLDGSIQQVEQFTDMYFQLAELEREIENQEIPHLPTSLTPQGRCMELAKAIFDLFDTVGTAYDADPAQMSTFILSLFTLWVRLDKYVAKECPLLLEYHPVFPPELLDALHLPDVKEMQRLRDIQAYLKYRCEKNKHCTTIFEEPEKDCFVVRYVAQSPAMETMIRKIQSASERSRVQKKNELEKWSKMYDEYSLEISSGTCVCTFKHDGTRDVRGCTKCYNWRTRNRMEIFAHEDFLPEDTAKAAAVAFELGAPDYIAAYRNATWKILGLAHPAKPTSQSPAEVLDDYKPLQVYRRNFLSGITVASTSKSFRGTHYKVAKRRMKASESDVLYPHGLEFSYFDVTSKMWVKNFDKPLTFQHLCGVHVPSALQSSVIPRVIHPPAEIHGPSSYEIVASETKCPPTVSIHEFTTYQRLLSGKNRRWLTMLVELGASEVNFSSESTMHIFNHLATQAGPAQHETSLFRDVHVVFNDTSFCDRLAVQVDVRLGNITTNWREVHCMEVLITLSLRLFALAPTETPVRSLLDKARNITLKWITSLRNDVKNAKEASAAKAAAHYAFWAALLCRRTFTMFAKSDQMIAQHKLSAFVQASMALQENLLVDLTKLSPVLKSMLVRDTKFAYKIKPLLLRSIMASPQSLNMVIDSSLSGSTKSTGVIFSDWHKFPTPHDRWIASTMTASTKSLARPQIVHYNIIEGYLLVDDKPLGKLPREIRDSDVVKQLFGDHHLRTYPSAEFGMLYRMVTRMNGHEIHFGIRDGMTIVRARSYEGLLEYIPSYLFDGPDTVDLPFGLVNNCAHWLNLNTRRIHIWSKPGLWKTRENDWIIDVATRQGLRSGRSSLVDPNSTLFRQVADIFRHFEEPRKITVFQPIAKPAKLSVELRHLELSFFVNPRGLLQCRELGEEIDPDQDGGTLYGFESKIVFRELVEGGRRSIIAPLGDIVTERRGMHVAVQAAGSGEYARFEIDDILGRLSCPPEPRLLYAKARLHAFTSFVLPDPLTGRTGCEEALRILQSGYCQPWAPLGDSPIQILKSIAGASPGREYYPKNKRTLQTISWNANLSMNIQHDAYEGLVQKILDTSERLRVFHYNVQEDIQISNYSPTHLRKRGAAKRRLYERAVCGDIEQSSDDRVYDSRGQQRNSMRASRVYQIANLLLERPVHINITRRISEVLEDWQLIGGFHDSSGIRPLSISDLTEKEVAEQWGTLVNSCRNSDPAKSYSLLFELSLLTLNSTTDMNAIKILAAFGTLAALKAIVPPFYASFSKFKLYEVPTKQSLLQILSVDLPKKPKRFEEKMQKKHREGCEAEAERLTSHLVHQWPSEALSLHGFESDELDTALAMERVVPHWRRLLENFALSRYIMEVQGELEDHKGPNAAFTPAAHSWTRESFRPPPHGVTIPSISRHLVVRSLPSPLENFECAVLPQRGDKQPACSLLSGKKTAAKEVTELRGILSCFTSSIDSIRQQYGHDLEISLSALEKTGSRPEASQLVPNDVSVATGIHQCRTMIRRQFAQIRKALYLDDSRFQWLDLGNLWPCNTSTEVLEQLRSSSGIQFGSNVKEALVSHGVLITTLQRFVRIRNATGLHEDLTNSGHHNWNPADFPDWLLLEIDSNMLIRPEQIDVAHAIIAPVSGQNMVLQLNMGKGKTSCIVPMVLAVIGNGDQLSRLIVPKSLLLPTSQMIQSRLGGLVGREIRHIPYSRRTRLYPGTLKLYADLHREMLHSGGVVLNAPDHVLSYKLSGLQHLTSISDLDVAQEMIAFQSWLNSTCRDVLDESDVSLSVKTQLIYPDGKQTTVDGHPHRWQVAQSLLALVKDHIPELRRKFPRSIEITDRGHAYPMIYILQSDVEEDLHGRIVDEICTGRTEFLRFADKATHEDTEIREVLLDTNLDKVLFERVVKTFADKSVASKTLLHVRGLLRNRILLLCLKKRWNVQYGLHPFRDSIAVPFEAKGVPSEQAEFGHPDAAILFTCLAFYYSGLNEVQFKEGLRQVLASQDPSSEYDRWTSGCYNLPEAFQHWDIINIDDQGQFQELWKHLRACRSVLDHYMNHFVFPTHAKQFEIKLQASGWDLPLFSKKIAGDDAPTRARTTGFSGTNDNKLMLPLTIRQEDLPSLHHTNAEVLTYLLQKRNRSYHLAARGGNRLSERDLLEKLKLHEIRVLIDAGACILEMDNETLVTTWLEIDTTSKAAVFFGSDNRAYVKYRGKKALVPLLATTFVNQMDGCLVYLDEAHTRGIDLKLPRNAHGALTIALGQTKDHTVQAAMRLRQLASTQSVSFFAFPETHQSILDVCKLNDKQRIDSSHVVAWLLEQTCCAQEQLQNLYIAQGIDFCKRTNVGWENVACLSDRQHRDAYVKVLRQPERQTLEQLYGCRAHHVTHPDSFKSSFPQIKTFLAKLDGLSRAATNNPKVLHSSALEEVEQEREVEFQVEEVREVYKPLHYRALVFLGLHPAISDFVRTGSLHGDMGYEHIFVAASRTSLGRKFGITGTESQLFVSAEFMRTVNVTTHGSIDNFLRPVEWILYSPDTLTALVIIAEEAEILIPELRARTSSTRVHLLTYAAPVTKKMLHFGSLKYYALPALPRGHSVPRCITIELGIFAGRLYLEFEECAPLVEYIENASRSERKHTPTTNMISFLREWLCLRRKGQDIIHTPVGYVCQGRTMDAEHAFFYTHRIANEDMARPSRIDKAVDKKDEKENEIADESGGSEEEKEAEYVMVEEDEGDD